MAKQETKQEDSVNVKPKARAKPEAKPTAPAKSEAKSETKSEVKQGVHAKPEAKSKQAAPKPATPKIRIHLKGYDPRVLDGSARDIVETAKRTGAGIAGPIPLPTDIQKYTVLVSPHVDKKSREQFEMREHKRLLIIEKPTSKTIDALKGLNVPAGVDIKIKA